MKEGEEDIFNFDLNKLEISIKNSDGSLRDDWLSGCELWYCEGELTTPDEQELLALYPFLHNEEWN